MGFDDMQALKQHAADLLAYVRLLLVGEIGTK